MMAHLVRITFKNFKAFKSYSISLRQFNILVGPNNAGKSTIIVSLRILAAALRKANSKKSEIVVGPNGMVGGYRIELKDISVADENIFNNYDESEPAIVEFFFSNKNSMKLYFPASRTCYLLPNADGKNNFSPTSFGKLFEFSLGFVPILGPVEHQERYVEIESARSALYNHGASRNFRNIWHHYPERFEEFRELLTQTWPGMDIELPKLERDSAGGKPTLTMFCPEERIPREIFWAGYGFQVWCQLLTHLVQSKDKGLFVIDEPDIYLHPDLQRQLLSALRSLGPDILIATHSTEIISEGEPDEIVLVDKKKPSAKRIKDPTQLASVFRVLGSNLNPLFTQLAKTRRALFVEGKDFQVLSKFALKLGFPQVAARRGFAVVPIEGFNLDRIRSIKKGIEETLGASITAAAVLDRDYRCQEQIENIEDSFQNVLDFLHVLALKEIENYLLIPAAIDRAALQKTKENSKRGGSAKIYDGSTHAALELFTKEVRADAQSQHIFCRSQYLKETGTTRHVTDLTSETLTLFENKWGLEKGPLGIVSGKDALSYLNGTLQTDFSISLSALTIVEAMEPYEIAEDMKVLMKKLDKFSRK